MPEGRRAVLARLHEAEPRVALRQRALVRCSRGPAVLSALPIPTAGIGYGVRDQPDGHDVHRRPARCGAQRRALRGASKFMRARHDYQGQRASIARSAFVMSPRRYASTAMPRAAVRRVERSADRTDCSVVASNTHCTRRLGWPLPNPRTSPRRPTRAAGRRPQRHRRAVPSTPSYSHACRSCSCQPTR